MPTGAPPTISFPELSSFASKSSYTLKTLLAAVCRSVFVVDGQTIKEIVEEIAPLLVGRAPGRVFQLSPLSLAIDFRGKRNQYLFLSAEPAQPRLHLITRRLRDLEKQSVAPSPFALATKKELRGATLESIRKEEGERIVDFSFRGRNDLGRPYLRNLVAQLTGRSANLLLLDEQGQIIQTLRSFSGSGQQIGDKYKPPTQAGGRVSVRPFQKGTFATLSEAADAYYQQLEAERTFQGNVVAARAALRRRVRHSEKLLQQMEKDLAAHSAPEEHKRMGDLLLANLANARRQGKMVKLFDYFAEGAPEIEIEVPENSTLQEEAARHFARYTRSKRAAGQIAKRIDVVRAELKLLHADERKIEQIAAANDEAALEEFWREAQKTIRTKPSQDKRGLRIPGVRRYRSTDGYEILVGRTGRDNDRLTFKIARPNDLWLHAADYPGSHTIVRNPARKEIPHRAIIEAAQLAAFFSQARKDAKVAVHYAERKFLAKPKGAAAGLVRMSKFKTILVAPRESIERA